MKHRIDPTVDCVFKALLGSVQNKNLLVHFLNAVIDPPIERRIISVEILNPYNEKEFLSDKLSIVDVKASDPAGVTYQIEIQLAVYGGLESRILYTWSDLYASQLKSGQEYAKLKPAISIWVLSGILFEDSKAYHHHFQPWDRVNKVLLNEHCSIHTLELEKWNKTEVELEVDRWTLFFRDGKELDDEHLPGFMGTLEMRQAMATLRQFSEKERAYDVYQRRMDYLREQATIRGLLDDALRDKERLIQEKAAVERARETAVREKEAVVREKEAAVQELDQLRRLLTEAGISVSAHRTTGDGNQEG